MALSTYTSDPSGARHFVGLANFETLLGNSLWSKPFWNAFGNNLIFFTVHMCVQNPIGIALAGLLSLPGLKLKGLYRTVMFLPTMLSVVIVGFLLEPDPLPALGRCREAPSRPWGWVPCSPRGSASESSALVTLSLISVWQFVGIPMMLIYAALLNIPEELIDAARVDGLGHFRIFLHIKLPLVLPTISLISVLTFVANFNAFDLIYSVKGALAGPRFLDRHSRHVLLPHLLRQPAATRQSDDGRSGRDRNVLHHSRRRLPLSLLVQRRIRRYALVTGPT